MRTLADRSEAKTTLTATGNQIDQAAALDPKQLADLPAELAEIVQQTLAVIARGGTVTIGALPDELTTTTAANMLGVSPPTLMKLLHDEALPSHKVGSHARVFARDVLAYRDRKRSEQRAALDDLRAFEDGLDQDH